MPTREAHKPSIRSSRPKPGYRRALPALEAARRSRRVSARSLAADIGCSAVLLSKIEKGELRASPELQVALASLFDASLDELFADAEARTWLTCIEAAQKVGVQKSTILRAIYKGTLDIGDPSPRPPYRIPAAALTRWNDERRSRPPGQLILTCDGCGTPFRRWRSHGATLSGQYFCSKKCELQSEPATAFRKERHEQHFQHVRDRLLSVAGACGSPGCSDQACDVPPGQCHRRVCNRRVNRASQTSTEHCWVRGHPIKYCSATCGVLDKFERGLRPHDAFYADLEALKAEHGLFTLRECARRLNRAPHTVLHHVRAFKLGRRVEGSGPGGIWLLTEDELNQVAQKMAESPKSQLHNDFRWRGRWAHRRFGTTKYYGHLGAAYGHMGAEAGIEAGRALRGGRPPAATPEQQQEMLLLGRQGLPVREIAQRVFGDERYKNRVHRFLRVRRFAPQNKSVP